MATPQGGHIETRDCDGMERQKEREEKRKGEERGERESERERERKGPPGGHKKKRNEKEQFGWHLYSSFYHLCLFIVCVLCV